MSDFVWTLAAIMIFAVIIAFIRGRIKDKCMKDFSGDMVTLEETDGETICGKLRVENTGLELTYLNSHKDKNGRIETSYILYKSEYPNIQVLIRYHDDMDEQGKRKRQKELERTYHPNILRRYKRRILNLFKTVRDSLMETLNLFIGFARKSIPGGKIEFSEKYDSRIKTELSGLLGTAYEPLLEPHIGKKVVVALRKADKVFEYHCILKDYTSEFIEVMDVDYRAKDEQPLRKADLVIPRRYGIVRHLGE